MQDHVDMIMVPWDLQNETGKDYHDMRIIFNNALEVPDKALIETRQYLWEY